jgi:spectinomycin phosphotransferase
VRSQPADLPSERLTEALAAGWRLGAGSLEYLPRGAGSHHWKLISEDGLLRFVTVDDLDSKSWLTGGRDGVFDGLRRALMTAAALRDRAGLEFVVAPTADIDGEIVRRLDDRYAVSVFPFLTGQSYSFGAHDDPWLRGRAVEMVAALHQSTATVLKVAGRHVPDFGGRDDLEGFLADPGRPWDGGPFAGLAHAVVAPRAAELTRLVAGFDDLVTVTVPARAEPVITHGEPHPGNLMSADGRVLLIDWDTAALGPPERDMCVIAGSGTEDLERYRKLTGRELDPSVLMLYRLRWYLDDVASAVSMFRSPHRDTADTRAWRDSLAPQLEGLSSWLDQLSP